MSVTSQILQPATGLAGSFTYSFISRINAQPYRISIALPLGYHTEDTVHYPVLFVLDADPDLMLAALIQRNLSYGHEVPDMIIVGIGYQVDNFLSSRPLRMLDYTTTQVPKTDSELTVSHHMKMVSGGAAGFLRVIRDEIIPGIEKIYKTNHDRCIYGHSLGGLFAAYVFFHQPELFTRYILSSPSLYWDDGEIFREETKFHSESHQIPNARIFISAGSLEPDPMIPDINRFVNQLKLSHYKNVELHENIFEGETHLSVVVYSISKGIRTVF
jgi:uncharacterized protein